ncbi:hypothetical protein OF83DRAFT_595871 [Amylostereum chailletii]|nr:hypothetical protein OF83DRAFT_595871 [Amylostereum chailletii]
MLMSRASYVIPGYEFIHLARYSFDSFSLTFRKLYLDGVFAGFPYIRALTGFKNHAGIVFVLCLVGLSTFNIMLIFIIPDSPATAIFIVPIRVFHALLSCRMLLNIRHIFTEQANTKPTASPIPRYAVHAD